MYLCPLVFVHIAQIVLSFLNFFDKLKEKVNILKSFADIEYVSKKNTGSRKSRSAAEDGYSSRKTGD